MKTDKDNAGRVQRTRAGACLLLAISAGAVLLAASCFQSPVQETVTVKPRSTTSPVMGTTEAKSIRQLNSVDIETEAAGDAIAHAIVALKTKHREEALYYMNLARARITGLTREFNRSPGDASANSDPTRESLLSDLRELDVAERSARHNDYQESVAQLHTISDQLDHLNSSLVHSLN